MADTTNETSVIGKHNNATSKGQRIAAITLIVLGALVMIFGIIAAISSSYVLSVALFFFGIGAIFCCVGILCLILANKRKVENGSPAILLSEDNTALTLMLSKGKEQTVNIADI